MENIKKELSNEQIIEMAKTIINAIKNANDNEKRINIDWLDLEEEWYDWLIDELTEKPTD